LKTQPPSGVFTRSFPKIPTSLSLGEVREAGIENLHSQEVLHLTAVPAESAENNIFHLRILRYLSGKNETLRGQRV
jgi:hypothetical protein